MFEKVLVANRGEIAVRVMRACEELGVDTVAIYSDADRDAGHVRYADEAYHVGPARAAESYLDVDAILAAVERSGADAVHPGYGFLAENAAFARAVVDSDATWVGPSPDAMERLGEKTKARRVMAEADVPVVPGTTEPVERAEEVADLGEEFGYPIAIKAEGGGGGRGLRVVESADDVESAFERARREGEAYFNNPSVYVEKFLPSPRHVEVQILADEHGNVRHLGERDCSLQRRHQKLIEEAPSPAVDADLRERLGEAARRGVEAAGYTNAGTVEFLVEDDAFYFMEVNTRIQVEHTVTEAITGFDVVKWQLRVAAGEPLDFDQDDVTFDGHAIEFRLNAENPAADFAPTPGPLTTYDPAGGIGVRVDDAVRQGDVIGGDYDSMIAKLVVHAADRDECLARSARALREFAVDGVHTTIPFHRLMLDDEAFRAGEHTTNYLDDHLDPAAIEAAVERWGPSTVGGGAAAAAGREFTVEVDGKRFEVVLEERGASGPAAGTAGGGAASEPGTGRSSATAEPSASRESSDRGVESAPAHHGDGETVVADMQGTILSVAVEPGDEVEPGDVLCVLEAMKMENDVVAGRGGTVAEVRVDGGESVSMGDVLVVIE